MIYQFVSEMNTEKKDDFRRAILFFYKHNLLISNIFHNFAVSFCISYVEIQKKWNDLGKGF